MAGHLGIEAIPLASGAKTASICVDLRRSMRRFVFRLEVWTVQV